MIFVSGVSLTFAGDLAKDRYFTFSDSWTSQLYVTPEKIYENCFEGDFYKEIDRSEFRLDENGWFYYSGSSFIPGAGTFSFNGENDSYAEEKGIYYNQFFKATYSSDTALTEKTKNGTVTYSAENLGKFAFSKTDHYESLSWNYNHVPWVEGE